MAMRGIKTKDHSLTKKVCLFLLLLLIFGVLVNSTRKVYNKRQEAMQALTRMESELKELENRQETLTASLQRLQTEEGVKFEMRKKLNVAEAGESVAIIVEEELSEVASTTKVSGWQKFKGFWTKLFSF